MDVSPLFVALKLDHYNGELRVEMKELKTMASHFFCVSEQDTSFVDFLQFKKVVEFYDSRGYDILESLPELVTIAGRKIPIQCLEIDVEERKVSDVALFEGLRDSLVQVIEGNIFCWFRVDMYYFTF